MKFCDYFCKLYLCMKNIKISRVKNDIIGGHEYNVEFDVKNLKNKPQKSNCFIKLFMGSIIGFVNGFWGGGGGMICVPILMKVLNLPTKKAHATTLFIMLPLSIVSIVVYILNGNLNYYDALRAGVGFVLGGVIGALLLSKISNFWLSAVFSLIIFIGGIKLML